MTTCVFVRSQVCTGAEEHGWTEAGGSRAGLRAEAGSRVQADEPQFERYAQPHAGDRQLGAFGGPTPGWQGRKQESFPPCVAPGSWQPPPRQDMQTEAASPVCAGQFWGHVSAHSRSKVCSWGDAYSRCRLVVSETNSSASQAAVISEAKVSNEGSADRTPDGEGREVEAEAPLSPWTAPTPSGTAGTAFLLAFLPWCASLPPSLRGQHGKGARGRFGGGRS